MTPIEKNIIVVDESGKEYESTWLKRAIGLVKKGRARWVNENTICLARPPKTTEESEMETENASVKLLTNGNRAEQKNNDLTLEGLLSRMDDIRNEMNYLTWLLDNWQGEECIGIGNAVEEREKTLRQMLSFLETIYRDRFAPLSQRDKTAAKESILDKMNAAIDNMSCKAVDGVNVAETIQPIMNFYGSLLDKL